MPHAWRDVCEMPLQNLEAADIVYVYDYCYYIAWLGDVHSYGREHEDGPGDHLFSAYTAMMQLPIWKKYGGGNFAFYDPHPGFMAGKHPIILIPMKHQIIHFLAYQSVYTGLVSSYDYINYFYGNNHVCLLQIMAKLSYKRLLMITVMTTLKNLTMKSMSFQQLHLSRNMQTYMQDMQ